MKKKMMKKKMKKTTIERKFRAKHAGKTSLQAHQSLDKQAACLNILFSSSVDDMITKSISCRDQKKPKHVRDAESFEEKDTQ